MNTINRLKKLRLPAIGLAIVVSVVMVAGALSVDAASEKSDEINAQSSEIEQSDMDSKWLAQRQDNIKVEPPGGGNPPPGGGNPPGGGGGGGGGGGKTCDDGETLEKDFTNLGEENSCSSHKVGENQCNHPDDNGSQGWLTDTVPDCGETAKYQEAGGCFKGGTGSDMDDCNGPAVIQDKEQTCSCVGGGGGTPSPVCGGVSVGDTGINLNPSCNESEGNCNTGESDNKSGSHTFSDPLPSGTEIDVNVGMSVEADGYDSRANTETTVELKDASGNTLYSKSKSLSVDNPPSDVFNSDLFNKTWTFSGSDIESVETVEVDTSGGAYPGPGGGGAHPPTEAYANVDQVAVSVTSPSCGNGNPNASNDGPIDVDQCSDSGGMEIDVLGNDSDPDNDSLEITSITSQPSEGSVSIIDGGDRVQYTPPSNYTGSVTFEYKVSDGNGGTDTAEVTINVTDNDCNSSPNADDDGNNDAQICSGTGSPIDINVLNNDSDPDGDNLSIDSVENPSNGTTAIIEKNGTDWIRYTPGSNTGTVTFDYTVVDGNGGSATATVTVNVSQGGCGQFRVRVEDPNGNVIQDAEFQPNYDMDGDGNPEEQLSVEKGDFTYNVTVNDNPRLGVMKQDNLIMSSIPDQYATSVKQIEKDVEQTTTPGGNTVDEPDDRTYQNPSQTESKLATDIAGSTPPPGGDNPPQVNLSCERSGDRSFARDCDDQYGPDGFGARFMVQASDPDNDLDRYEWLTQGGDIDQTTDHPDQDIQYCFDESSNFVNDNLDVDAYDDKGNLAEDSGTVGDMCLNNTPPPPPATCNEVSVQSDFSGDELESFDDHECSGGESSARYCSRAALNNREAKTATLDVSSVLDSGETAGDIIFDFGPSLNDNFVADVDCNSAEGPGDCQASAEITVDSGGNRLLEVSGSDAEPDPPEVKDTSDFSTNVSASDNVEVTVDADAGLGRNTEEYRGSTIEADSGIRVQDIKLEVCN